ncbi:MAG: thioredoxin reductase [Pseudonocardiales bacterium]|nr:thioredoxin reductase [Pseudonocardiales bacterium]
MQVEPGICVRTVFLAQRVPEVSLIVRENQLGTTMSRYLIDQIEANPRLKILSHSEVRLLRGQDGLESVEVEDLKIGAPRTLAARAVFVFIGAAPCTTWLRGSVNLDGEGFVLTGEVATARSSGRQAALLETSLPGVFAAADVRSGSVKRVASSVGEGAMAMRFIHEFLN